METQARKVWSMFVGAALALPLGLPHLSGLLALVSAHVPLVAWGIRSRRMARAAAALPSISHKQTDPA